MPLHILLIMFHILLIMFLQAPKVRYLDKIKKIPSPEGRNGEIALLCHQQQLAEQIFLQAGLVYRAIDLHIRLCNWEK